MAAYLDSLLAALSDVDPLWAYGILLLSAFLENIVPPIPGDTVVVFSALFSGARPLGYMAGFSRYLCRGHGRLFSHVLFGL